MVCCIRYRTISDVLHANPGRRGGLDWHVLFRGSVQQLPCHFTS